MHVQCNIHFLSELQLSRKFKTTTIVRILPCRCSSKLVHTAAVDTGTPSCACASRLSAATVCNLSLRQLRGSSMVQPAKDLSNQVMY